MRLLLSIIAVATLAAFCMRVQHALGFAPERQRQSLHLLADGETRRAAFLVYLRGDPATTLAVLRPTLVAAPGGATHALPADLLSVHALLYVEALGKVAPEKRDPGGNLRSAFTSAAPDPAVDPTSHMLYQAILGLLGSPQAFPEALLSTLDSSEPPRYLAAVAWLLASTGDPRAPDAILALKAHWPVLTSRTGLEPRIHAARALHSLRSPAGVDLLISALSNARTITQQRDIEAELRQMTGAAVAGSAGQWQDWWATQRDRFAAGDPIGNGPWFSFAAGPLVLVVCCLIVYLMIAWVRSVRRWNNGWGMIALTTAVYLVLRELIGNHIAASPLPYTPYGLRSAAYLVDTVLLPYHVILFTLLAAFTPKRKSQKKSA